jgi:hypothetical protein
MFSPLTSFFFWNAHNPDPGNSAHLLLLLNLLASQCITATAACEFVQVLHFQNTETTLQSTATECPQKI